LSSPLALDVYVAPYLPIQSFLPSWDANRQATWPASSVSLLSGEKEAVLIDALITNAEAANVVAWIRAKKKTLTTVYITHGHGDHFFGLNTILAAFPEAKAVALPEVMPAIGEQVGPAQMAFWSGVFPNQIPERPRLPEAMRDRVITLEGRELRPVIVGQSDTFPSTVVHVPDLDAVVGGDVAYNGIHCWLAQTDRDRRQGWLASLDLIAALKPKIVVAGHKGPSTRDDGPTSILDATRAYIRDFDAYVNECSSPKEIIDKMMQRYGDRGNPYTLWTAAEGVSQQLRC